jgi:hypothetical protein
MFPAAVNIIMHNVLALTTMFGSIASEELSITWSFNIWK